MSTINPNESLDNKLEQNKQKEFAEERKVLTKKELSELNSPFKSDLTIEEQKQALLEAKRAEEADNDDIDYEIGSTIFEENSIEGEYIVNSNIEEIKDEDLKIEKSDSEFIGEQIVQEGAQSIATEAILGTATGGVSTVISAVSTISTINDVSEHIEKKDDISIKKNKENFKENFGEEARELYTKGLVEVNEKNNLNKKYKFNDLLEHVGSNYETHEYSNGQTDKNKDLNLAFNETITELLEGKHNQNIEKIEEFKIQLKHASNLEEKYNIFLKIDNEIDKGEGIAGKKQKQEINRLNTKEKKDNEKLQAYKLDIIKKIQNNNTEDPKTQEELKNITQDLYNDEKELTQSDIDTINDNVSDLIGEKIKEG